jgi:hypothetical protein
LLYAVNESEHLWRKSSSLLLGAVMNSEGGSGEANRKRQIRTLLHFSDIKSILNKSEICYALLTWNCPMSRSISSIPSAIRARISAPAQPRVWTPEDFADLGPRTAVDQALHRLVASRALRRIARGFYDIPQANRLTGKPTYPNPRDVIDALARKGKVRVVVDGLTAANELGLTDAVPARIGVLTDGRMRPITLGNLTLDFQAAAPSRLYWAGRPAMRFVQALHWLRDMLPSDDGSLRKRLISILKDPDHGRSIQDDLRSGLSALPEWMRVIVRDLFQEASAGVSPPGTKGKPARRSPALARTITKKRVSLSR